MSNILFTSDLHIGHYNIIKYAGRPFHDANHMFRSIRDRWNSRVKPEDIVVHVGDFCNRGNERGVLGSRAKYREYEKELNGTIIYIRGNHDRNNGLKHAFEYAVIELGGIDFLVIHRPPQTEDEIPAYCKAVICGHVHQHWKEQWLGDRLLINVGVDVRKFSPVFAYEIVGIYTHALRVKQGLRVGDI